MKTGMFSWSSVLVPAYGWAVVRSQKWSHQDRLTRTTRVG